jgi:phosphatidylglycerophosphate synthase
MDLVAFAIAIGGLLFGAGLFLTAVYHHKYMWNNRRADRKNIANFAGIFAPFIPGLLTEQGYAHQWRFVAYLFLAVLFFIPFIAYIRGHGHLYPIN